MGLHLTSFLWWFLSPVKDLVGGVVLCSALLPLLLEGVGAHLDSTTPALRAIGQVVGKGVVTKLDCHGNQLKFEVGTVSIHASVQTICLSDCVCVHVWLCPI